VTVLALDLGTTTGFATKTPAGNIVSGIQSFKQSRFDGGGMRFLKFKRWLTEIKQSGVSEVYYEAVRRHAGTDAAHCYGGYLATLQLWCEQHEIPYAGVPVGTIKKFACGNGRASKQEMIDFASSKGFKTKTHDEADAIAILFYVTESMNRD